MSEPTTVQPEQQKPQRVRRVGTITMGICLIIAGLALCWGLMGNWKDLIVLAKLSPVILVAVGVEVLVFACAKKQEKLKYDFLSIFICFCLIVGAIGGACLVPLLEYYGPEANYAQQTAEKELEESLYAQLKDNKDIINVDVNIYFYNWKSGNNLEVADTRVVVTLANAYQNEKEFLQACEPIINTLQKTKDGASLHIWTQEDNKNNTYYLDLEGLFLMNRPIEELEDQVQVMVYNKQENFYMDQAEYERWQRDASEMEQDLQEQTEEEAFLQEEMA